MLLQNNPRYLTNLAMAVGTACAVLFPQAGQAALYSTTSTYYESWSSSPPTNSTSQTNNQSVTDASLGPVSSFTSDSALGNGASSSAFANYGVLQLNGQAGSIGSTDPGLTTAGNRGVSQASAAWNDFLYVNAPGMTGSGVLHASILVSGSFALSGVGAPTGLPGGFISETSGSFSVQSTGFNYLAGENSYLDAAGVSNHSGAMFGNFLIDIPFTFGNAIPLTVNFNGNATARTSGYGSGNAGYDLSHSLYWGGISSITAGGAPVSFTISSTSNFDYLNSAAPVPIPAAVWLFGSGLLGLIGFARRRRR